MMRDDKSTDWAWWLSAALIGVGVLLMLSGCFSSPRLPAADSIPSAGDGSAGTLVERIAYWGTGIGALAVVAAIAVAIWFDRKAGGRLAITGIGTIVCCQALLWVGAYLAWITLVCLLGILAVGYWRNRRRIERIVGRDLDGDGQIGETPSREHG